MTNDSIWSNIKNFFKVLFKNDRKKCATVCKCKGCCFDCTNTCGYDEKNSDDSSSEEDIVISKNKVVIK